MGAIVTPLAVLSFPSFYEKKPVSRQQGAALKYQGSFVFTPELLAEDGEQELFEAMKEAIIAAGQEKFGADFAKLLKAGALKMPLHSTEAKPDYYGWATEGSVYLNARSDREPQLYTEIPNAEGLPSPLTDPNKIYPGTIGRGLLSFYGFDNVSKGVGVGLEGFQWVRDGESLVTRVDAQEVFGVNPQAKANLADVAGAAGGENLQGLI